VDDPWSWDESLYAGSAAYYERGRMPYPIALAKALRGELSLDGSGRLIDVGCGPGSLALLLSEWFDDVVGVDADRDMLDAGRAAASRLGVGNVTWRHLRAEALPDDLGTFRVATFAQSFHWMQRERVAAIVRDMLEPGGAWVHVNATTHRGGDDDALPEPAPPRTQIGELIRGYLGAERRAGRGVLPAGTPSGEEQIMQRAGFEGPTRLQVGGEQITLRSEDEIVASIFSLSSAAPHLFGERLGEFDEDLRTLLREASPSGRFAERPRPIELVIWR
jgi:SAM-dependent methyltransferase